MHGISSEILACVENTKCNVNETKRYTGFGIKMTDLQPGSYYLIPTWLLANLLTSLSFSFLIFKMEIIPTLWGCPET